MIPPAQANKSEMMNLSEDGEDCPKKTSPSHAPSAAVSSDKPRILAVIIMATTPLAGCVRAVIPRNM
jgi:hypothetical protein